MSDLVDYPVSAAVAGDAARRRSVEREWRMGLGAEPVLGSLDTDGLHEFVATSGATQADVLRGIEAAMAKDGFRIRHWSSLIGWVRKATEQRMLLAPKATPRPAARDPSLLRFPGDVWVSRAQVAADVESWRAGKPWDETRYGFAPDSPYTDVPIDLRGQRRRATG